MVISEGLQLEKSVCGEEVAGWDTLVVDLRYVDQVVDYELLEEFLSLKLSELTEISILEGIRSSSKSPIDHRQDRLVEVCGRIQLLCVLRRDEVVVRRNNRILATT